MHKKDLALIGIGYWGKNLARNFHSLGVLHTICDTNEGLLNKYKERYPDISDEEMIDLVIGNKPFATTEELKDILKKLKKHNAI